MTSLRERQKERRSREILDAATALIGEKGYDETSVEEIAARAEVGVATVYNYFGSKNELLHALLAAYIEGELARGATVVSDPPQDMVDGMAALFGAYLDGMERTASKRLMQEFLAMAVSKQFAYGQHTYRMKMAFMEQCRQLALHYEADNQIRADVTAEDAALVCYSAVTLPYTRFLLDIEGDVRAAQLAIRRNLSLVISGLGANQEERK